MGTKEHKENTVKNIKIGIITLSSTRGLADDESGKWIKNTAQNNLHEVLFHQLIPDQTELIRETVINSIKEHSPQILLMTGGTGISPKDVTIEAVKPLFEKEMTAFGTLFAQLSFQEIGSAAILSRAAAGIIGKTAVFCMPGSLKACQLACNSIIFPEMGHLVKHLDEK